MINFVTLYGSHPFFPPAKKVSVKIKAIKKVTVYTILFIAIAVSAAMYYFIPRMVKKYAAGTTAQQTDEYLAAAGQNAGTQQKEILNDPGLFKPVMDSVGGETITGIASCMEKRDFTDVAYQAMIKVINKSMGSGYRQVDNYDAYFLVLTANQLHYFVYDEKRCEKHLAFPLKEIQQLTISNTNAGDNITGGNMTGKKLSFMHNGTAHKFYYFESIIKTPDNRWFSFINPEANKERIKLTALLAKPFTDAINKMAQ
jgi:hypothetical protein